MSFHKATKSLAKELDPDGNLIPVRSSIDHEDYRPFCLLNKKTEYSLWKTVRFLRTGYKLTDVVRSDGHGVKLEVKDGDKFIIKEEVEGTVGGQISGCDIAAIDAHVITQTMKFVKVKRIQLCPTTINSVKQLKIDMDHEFIKQTRKHKEDLYIVTEAVEAVEDAPFRESSQMGGGIFYKDLIKMWLKGTRIIRKEFHFPKSCILAFRAKKLLVEKESVGISYYPYDNGSTWIYDESGERAIQQYDNEIPMLYSMKIIHENVEDKYVQFSFLSANLRSVFLTGFLAVMRNTDLLQKLMFQLEEVLETSGQYKLKADEPELQALVENLEDGSGVIITELAKAVVYFLKALDELEEEQLMLLEESVEKKIVPKQLALINIILDNILSNDGKFTVDVQFLSEEEILIMGAMIEMSGVTVQKTEAHLTGTAEPVVLMPLFVVLYALSLLTKQEDT